MSLHKFAEQVAAHGRGDDSLLIHMTPDEVSRLQAFAEANGRTLTINPHTGLPEAGFLSDLFKAVAPIALGAFLGPGAFGIAGLGLSAGTAGLVTGGLTTLATGSLSRGLMAGLGAYGGAGLAQGFADAGANALGAQGTAGALGVEGAATGAGSQAAMLAEQTSGFGTEGLSRLADSAKVASGASPVMPSAGTLMSKGFEAAGASPMQFAKQNWQPIAAAALPVLGAIQTTTPAQASKPTDTGYIRQKIVNQDGTVTSLTPVKASEWGDRNFSDVYRGYNGGGIVALADGGIARFAGNEFSFVKDASGMSQADINAALAAELGARGGSSLTDIKNYAKTGYNLSDAQINAALDTIPGFNAQGQWDAKDYMANDKPGVDYQLQVDAANAANPFSAQNMAKVDTTRPGHYVDDPITGKTVALTNYSPGFDINNPTALTYLGAGVASGKPDSAAQWFLENATPEQKAKADSLWAAELARLQGIDRAAGRLPALGADTKAPTGLAGLNQNQNLLTNQKPLVEQNQNAGLAALANLPAGASAVDRWFVERGLGLTPIDTSINKFLATYKNELAAMTPKQQEDTMRAALDVENMNEADVIRATGKTIAQLVQAKRNDGSIIVPGKLEEVPVGSLPGGVSGAGITDINANGTITTRPDITGLTTSETRKMYTDGGGSLGYVSPAPRTIAEFEQMYNKQTGDSLAAYNYLMGKGAYPTKSSVGEIEKPYRETVLGYPTSTNKMYNWDATTGRMVRNPDYVAPGRDAAGNVTYGMSLNDIKKALTDTPLSGQALYDWAQTNKLSAQQIADATGRTLSSVYADFRAGSQAKSDKAADVAKGGDSIQVTDSSGYNTETVTATKQADGTYLGSNGKKYDASGKLLSAGGGMMGYAIGGGLGSLGSYSDGGRLLKGPGDGVSDSIPATIGAKQQPARLADGEFVIPARIVSELGNGSTDAGAKKLYAMMDRVQRARSKTTGKNKVAANSRADKYLPA